MSKNKSEPLITYTEFGVRTEIYEIEQVSTKLKGMRSGKPFFHQGDYYVNFLRNLNRLKKFKFFDSKSETELAADEVDLDTITRVGAIIITTENKILLIKRQKQDKKYFAYPGGHQRQNESLKEAISRELTEEAGIKLDKDLFTFFSEEQLPDFGPEKYFKLKPDIDLASLDLSIKNPENSSDPDNYSEFNYYDLEDLMTLENVYPVSVTDKLISEKLELSEGENV
jgi:8-oxo-dGTP pyrophosphatase MutT (NUDIX family)